MGQPLRGFFGFAPGFVEACRLVRLIINAVRCSGGCVLAARQKLLQPVGHAIADPWMRPVVSPSSALSTAPELCQSSLGAFCALLLTSHLHE